MSETENKNKNADEILKIIKYILDYNKNAQKKFRLHQKLIKANQCLKNNNWKKYWKGCKSKKQKDCWNWRRRKKHKQWIV